MKRLIVSSVVLFRCIYRSTLYRDKCSNKTCLETYVKSSAVVMKSLQLTIPQRSLIVKSQPDCFRSTGQSSIQATRCLEIVKPVQGEMKVLTTLSFPIVSLLPFDYIQIYNIFFFTLKCEIRAK